MSRTSSELYRVPLRFKSPMRSPSQGVRRLWRGGNDTHEPEEKHGKVHETAFVVDTRYGASFSIQPHDLVAADAAAQQGAEAAAKMARDLGLAQQELEEARGKAKELREQLGVVVADRQAAQHAAVKAARDLKLAQFRVKELESKNNHLHDELDDAIGDRRAAQQAAVIGSRDLAMIQLRVQDLDGINGTLRQQLASAVEERAAAEQAAARGAGELEAAQALVTDLSAATTALEAQLGATAADRDAARNTVVRTVEVLEQKQRELGAMKAELEGVRSSNQSMQQQLGVAAHAVTLAANAAMSARSMNDSQLRQLRERVSELEDELGSAASDRKLLCYLQQQATEPHCQQESQRQNQEEEAQQRLLQQDEEHRLHAVQQQGHQQQQQQQGVQQQRDQQRHQQQKPWQPHFAQPDAGRGTGVAPRCADNEGGMQRQSFEAVLAAGAVLAAEVAAAAECDQRQAAEDFGQSACSKLQTSSTVSPRRSSHGVNSAIPPYVLNYNELECVLISHGSSRASGSSQGRSSLTSDVSMGGADSIQPEEPIGDDKAPSSAVSLAEGSEWWEVVVEDGAKKASENEDATSIWEGTTCSAY